MHNADVLFCVSVLRVFVDVAYYQLLNDAGRLHFDVYEENCEHTTKSRYFSDYVVSLSVT